MQRKGTQYFLLFLALLTLNSSVDIPDYKLYFNTDAQQNTSVNEMESVAEIVAECIMDMPNEFPEQRNDDTNPNNVEKKNQTIKYREEFKPLQLFSFVKIEDILPLPVKQYKFNFIREITPPPPKA